MHKEILEKAIKKAIDGGWKSDYEGFVLLPPDKLGMVKWAYWMDMGNEQIKNEVYSSYNDILFDKSFAKALWDNEGYCIRCEENMVSSEHKDWCFNAERIEAMWCWHLQQMVIAEDPIKYLGENI